MAKGGQSLRLAAIVFTDIVGYSAIVNRDSVLGAKLLDRQRSVVRKCLAAYGGREVETAGDSFLLEFSSALKALECVADIQRRLQKANADFPDAERVQIRASIHLGDVEHRAKEVFGDGVNVAARIMPFSPEGGVAFSETVQQQVRNRIQVRAKSIGSPPLKNIAHPIEVFTLEAAEMAAIQSTTIPEPESAAPAKSRIIWVPIAGLAGCLLTAALLFWLQPRRTQAEVEISEHSIAVLPFTNLSGDPNNAYFADGMQDEILTALAKISSLKVMSRTSVERFRGKSFDVSAISKALAVATVLEGSVQREGDKVRVNVQLIDTRTGAHRWAETYDRGLGDLFKLQSEVSQDVARALSVNLAPDEAQRLSTPPTQDARAYDLYLQAQEHYRRAYDPLSRIKAEMPLAIALYERSVRLDPNFALAFAMLGHAHIGMYHHGHDRTNDRLSAAKTAIDQALSLQPALGEAHFSLGLYYYQGLHDYARATTELQLASRSLPNDPGVKGNLAAIARRQGRWDDAVTGFSGAASREQGAHWLDQLAVTYSMLRRYEEADAAYTRSLALSTSPLFEVECRGANQLMWKGDLAAMRRALDALPPEARDYNETIANTFILHWLERDYSAASTAVLASKDAWIGPSDFENIALPQHLLAGRALAMQGKKTEAGNLFNRAIAQVQDKLGNGPENAELHISLGLAYAGLGRRDEAIHEAERAVALKPIALDAMDGPATLLYLARVYVQVGQLDRALGLLTQLMGLPAGQVVSPALLKLDPDWDPVRDDPRFKALLAAPAKT